MPSMVRQGMNRSQSAVSVPTRASRPSEMTSSSLKANRLGDVLLVGLELVEGALDRGVLVAGVLELDHGQGQAVDEDDQVGAAVVLVLDDGELVDGQPVVLLRVCEVDQPDLVAGDRAVRAPVLDIHAIGEHPVEPAVVLDQARRLGPGDLAEGFVEGRLGDVRVKPFQGRSKAIREHDLPEVRTLSRRLAWGDLRPLEDGIAQTLEPVEGGVFDGGFADWVVTHWPVDSLSEGRHRGT